jgi:hypothetical protein
MRKKIKDCPKISTIFNDDGGSLVWRSKLYSTVDVRLEPPTISAEDATVLGSIPASSDTVGS